MARLSEMASASGAICAESVRRIFYDLRFSAEINGFQLVYPISTTDIS